jgi:hypothetical protein
MSWRLTRTQQCKTCPWIKGVDPRTIPNGYSVKKHRALASTIAEPGALSFGGVERVMACHEGGDAHCIGWLVHQLGRGNNIPLRIRMTTCANAKAIRLRGEQHKTFEDTLPKRKRR